MLPFFCCRLLARVTAALAVVVLASGCREPAPANRPLPPGPPPAGVVPVQVLTDANGRSQLLRGGRPFFVKGAAGTEHLAALKQAGGNSVRTWSTEQADSVLVQAQRHGLTVMLGIWLGRETDGFDYYDQAAVARQRAEVRRQVLRYRRHPALLMWNLGNELDLDAENPVVYKEVNELARLIHTLDPYHPVTTTMSGRLHMLRYARKWCPELDLLALNAFGSLHTLPEDLADAGWRRPYLITEFGGKGYWEADVTPWQEPLEQSSTAKADFIRRLYRRSVLGDSARCLGAYAFYWGFKQEFTGSWFSLFTPAGEKTAVVDALAQLWSGRAPTNQAPHITTLQVAGRRDVNFPRLRPGQLYPVQLVAHDPEGQTLRTQWEVLPDLPLDLPYEQRIVRPAPVAGAIVGPAGLRTTLRAPTQPGAYRLCLTASDGQGSAATATLPFEVMEEAP